jgi:hypothetical protein
MTMKKALLAPVAGALMLVAGTVGAQAQDACSTQISLYLKQFGVDYSKMTDVTLTPQRWAHKGDANGPIYGYSFEGTPAQCSSGSIQMGLDTGCEVSHAATTPGCTIKGIPSVWW